MFGRKIEIGHDDDGVQIVRRGEFDAGARRRGDRDAAVDGGQGIVGMAFEVADARPDVVAREFKAVRARGDGDAERACRGAGAQAFAQRNGVVEVHAHARKFFAHRMHRVDEHAFEADVRRLFGAAEFQGEAVCRFDHGAGAQIQRNADRIEARPEIGAGGGNAYHKRITQLHVCHPERSEAKSRDVRL